MVTTRNSTGSLPPPKLTSLTEDQSEEEVVHVVNETDEGEEGPIKKRAKKARLLTRQPAEENKGRSEGEADDGPNDGRVEASYKKSNRMDFLLTGPSSKSEIRATKPIARKDVCDYNIREEDLGKLEQIKDLSVEVFSEITRHLTPNDLLNLARTSRYLRAFLMSKSSRTIWLASFNSIGFPPCPSDMSEPQYANLFFEKECHACGYPRVERNTYHLRVRLCVGCATVNIQRGVNLLREMLGAKASENYEILTLLPWNNFNPSDINWRQKATANAQHHFYIIHDFLEIIDAYMKTRPKSEERKSFVAKRHQLLDEIAKNIRDVEAWQREQHSVAHDSKKVLGGKRKEQIVDKLVAIGYPKDEINSMSLSLDYWPLDCGRDWERLVCQPKELTDGSWKRIRPKLEALIASKRKYEEDNIAANRRWRKEEVSTLYSKYVYKHKLDKADGVPLCFSDLLEDQSLKDLLEENKCEIKMTRERWSAFEPNLPKIQEDHSRRVERDCLNALHTAVREGPVLGAGPPGGVAETNFDASVLRRAYTFFYYDNFSCNYKELLSRRQGKMLYHYDYGCRAWRPNLVSADALKVQAARALLMSSGLPKDTTMEHAISLGNVFVCKQCDPILRKSMTWDKLILHLCTEIRNYKKAKVTPASADVPLLETHKLESNAGPLAVIDRDFLEPSANSLSIAHDKTGRILWHIQCRLCDRLSIPVFFEYDEQFKAHVRAYHSSEIDLPY